MHHDMHIYGLPPGIRQNSEPGGKLFPFRLPMWFIPIRWYCHLWSRTEGQSSKFGHAQSAFYRMWSRTRCSLSFHCQRACGSTHFELQLVSQPTRHNGDNAHLTRRLVRRWLVLLCTLVGNGWQCNWSWGIFCFSHVVLLYVTSITPTWGTPMIVQFLWISLPSVATASLLWLASPPSLFSVSLLLGVWSL